MFATIMYSTRKVNDGEPQVGAYITGKIRISQLERLYDEISPNKAEVSFHRGGGVCIEIKEKLGDICCEEISQLIASSMRQVIKKCFGVKADMLKVCSSEQIMRVTRAY